MNAHGEVSLKWKNDLLIVNAKGPFNEIGLQESINLIQQSILNKKLKAWRKIEIWDEETIGSPAVITLAKEAYHWYKIKGCYASTVVISHNIQNHIIQNITDNINESGGKTFFKIEEALQWIDSQKNID